MDLEGSTDGGMPSLSADEEAFFSSGGEKAPANDGGATDQGSQTPNPKIAAEPKNDHVPLATFLEEKKARKELATKYQETEKQLAEFRGKFSIIDRLNQPAKVEEPKIPTPEEDIFGAVNHVGQTVAQLQKRLDDQVKANDEATKAQNDHQEFVGKYKADAATFEAATPDFKAAYDFILNSRAAELKAIGYDTPQALHQALVADEMAIAQMAFEKGKSPAEMLYNLATQRGYKKASPEPGKGAERLETIERGQAANKSLSSTGGSAGDPEMTAQALIDMDIDEFEAWTNKNPAKAKRLLGG